MSPYGRLLSAIAEVWEQMSSATVDSRQGSDRKQAGLVGEGFEGSGARSLSERQFHRYVPWRQRTGRVHKRLRCRRDLRASYSKLGWWHQSTQVYK